MYHVPCYCSQKNSKEDTFSAIGCNCSNVFDYFFHGKRIHHHRDTKLKKTLWGWVDADWDGDREDEGQLLLHHRDKDTGDHLPVIFVHFPVLECEWTVSGLSIQISTSTQDHTEKESKYISLLQWDRSVRGLCTRLRSSGLLNVINLHTRKSVHTHGHQFWMSWKVHKRSGSLAYSLKIWHPNTHTEGGTIGTHNSSRLG